MTKPPAADRGLAVETDVNPSRTLPQAHPLPRSDTFPASQRRCPLVAAVRRDGDPDLTAVVLRLHPPVSCPAARRARHLQAVSGG